MLLGCIQFGGDQLSSPPQHVRSGALKAMAVATPPSAMPNVPTVRQPGFPLSSPRGGERLPRPQPTPAPVVARLHQEIAAASKHPDVRKRMAQVGAEPSGSTPDEMRKMLRSSRSPR